MIAQEHMLTASNVTRVFDRCISTDGEGIVIEGVICSVIFDEAVLNDCRETIIAMLGELPREFHQNGGGGGWSMLSACINAQHKQWSDSHRTVEQLIMLGLAIGKVEFCTPRSVWHDLPGGMPYFRVLC